MRFRLKKKHLFIALATFLAVFFFSPRHSVTEANTSTVTVATNVLNVRSGPGMAYDVFSQVTYGSQYQVLAHSDGWYQIQFADGSTGWVASWLVTTQESQPAAAPSTGVKIVGLPAINVYQSNDFNSPIIANAYQGESLEVVYESNGWSQVNYYGTYAWVESYYLTDAQQNTASYVDNSASTYGQSYYTSNKPLHQATIVIDAGHGGYDPGALSNNGQVYESNVALNTAQYLANRLAYAGANVIMTRTGDYDVSLADRAYYSNVYGADAFISIHYDAARTPNSASGTSTYYYGSDDEALAYSINNALATYGSLPNRGIMFGNFQVLRDNYQPAVLVELGFMNNDYDASLIATDFYQNQMADALYNGLASYFN